MRLRIGDRVRIKSWDEICKLGTPVSPEGRIEFSDTDNIIFNEYMKEFCGREYLIKDIVIVVHTPVYILTPTLPQECENENDWNWLEDWLEKVEG